MFALENFCSTTVAENTYINKPTTYSLKGVFIAFSNFDSFEIEYNNTILQLNPLDIIISPMPLTIKTTATNIEYVILSGTVIDEYTKELQSPLLLHSPRNDMYIEQINSIKNSTSKENNNTISKLCYSLFCDLLNENELAKFDFPLLVTEAINLIHADYMEILGVEQLAETLNVSKEHLVRTFKKHTNTTPGNYLTKIKINVVKQFLQQEDYTLDIIADLCGFANASYLCKVFKKHTGITPLQYKSSVLNIKESHTLKSTFSEVDDTWVL